MIASNLCCVILQDQTTTSEGVRERDRDTERQRKRETEREQGREKGIDREGKTDRQIDRDMEGRDCHEITELVIIDPTIRSDTLLSMLRQSVSVFECSVYITPGDSPLTADSSIQDKRCVSRCHSTYQGSVYNLLQSTHGWSLGHRYWNLGAAR